MPDRDKDIILKEDAPNYHIIATGSLLGVAVSRKTGKRDEWESNNGLNDTFPVGKVIFWGKCTR